MPALPISIASPRLPRCPELARKGAGAFALVAACALAGACGTAAPPSRPVAPAAGEGESVLETAISDLAMPGPERARGEAAVAENGECERCHADVAAEWRASLHRAAHEDAAYQRAFALEPLAFCTGCHAPEARSEGPVSRAEGALGVGCVTCHVTSPGTVLAAPLESPPTTLALTRAPEVGAPGASAPEPGTPEPGAAPLADSTHARGARPGRASPHRIVRDARFAASGACAACHEFEFPDRAMRRAAEQMQSTVSEHRSSSMASRPCAECHMPRSGRRRSHAFAASRDEAFVRSAVRVRAERPSPSVLRVTLSPAGAGHAFPTGDLFRRIEVLGEVVGPETSLLREEARYLARHFESVRAGPALHRVLVRDDRVEQGPSPRVVDLDLGPEAAGRPVAFRVAYQRVENTRSVDDRSAPLDGEIVLAEGVLAP